MFEIQNRKFIKDGNTWYFGDLTEPIEKPEATDLKEDAVQTEVAMAKNGVSRPDVLDVVKYILRLVESRGVKFVSREEVNRISRIFEMNTDAKKKTLDKNLLTDSSRCHLYLTRFLSRN